MPRQSSGSDIRLRDGSFSFEMGVDSGRVTTLQSQLTPYGLPRNSLSWLINASVRGGGITPRSGWNYLCTVHDASALYQGGWMYEPRGDSDPHLMWSIGGRLYRIRVDTDNSVEDFTASYPGTENPPNQPQAFFTQGEEFMIVQAGDYLEPGAPFVIRDWGIDIGTQPLFYDGKTLRRSNGIVTAVVPNAAANTNELPPATSMTYYMGRIWYARTSVVAAGDIVGGPTGSAPYNKRDSILKVFENPLSIGGDGFPIPANARDIRALRSTTELDTALGQGNLYIGTRKSIFRLQVPVTRNAWIAANTNNQPLLTVSQKQYGFYGDRAVVEHNSDLFYKAIDGTRSLALATRYFQQWGNTPISSNIERILSFNDRALMKYTSGIEFNNRIIFLELPYHSPVGPAFRACSVLDVDLLSTLQEKLPPAWDGIYEGLDFLQLFQGDFGGRIRAFAAVHSRVDHSIQLWELTASDRFDGGDKRVSMVIEWPAFTFSNEMAMKQLGNADLWVDRLFGTVDFRMEYRTDSDPCWRLWYEWQQCVARSSCEDQDNPVCYPNPETPYGEGFRSTMTLPDAPSECVAATGRNSNFGYQFQPRLIVRGFCRVRGIMLYAYPTMQGAGDQLLCKAP